MNGEGLIMYTVSHELVHFMRDGSKAAFNRFADFLVEHYADEGMSLQELIDSEIETAKRNGHPISRDTAYEEVIARLSENFLTDAHLNNKAELLYKQNKSLAQKILDWLKDIRQKIADAFNGVSPQSEAGKIGAKIGKQFDQAIELYAQGIREAAESIAAKENTTGEGGVRMMARENYEKADQNAEIIAMVDNVIKGEFKDNDKVDLGVLPPSVYQRIQQITGVDVTGYRVLVEARQVEHILKDHGSNGKTDRSMADPSDIAKMMYVLASPDYMSYGGRTQAYSHMVNGFNKTADTVLYEKVIDEEGGKSYYVVQAAVDTKAKAVYIVTAYIGDSGKNRGKIKETAQLINANNRPNATPKNGSVVVSNIIIPDSSENSNPSSKKTMQQSRDADYLSAVERGDMQTAQRMVDEAARAAGYDMHLYHGAKSGGGFTVFKGWQYFTDDQEYAEKYTQRSIGGKSLYDVYVHADRLLDTRKPADRAVYEQYKQEYGMSDLEESGLPSWVDGYDLSEIIEETGLDYDGIILDEGTQYYENGKTYEDKFRRVLSYVIKDSSQVKSADPVTYDDAGNVIPLSQRFNSEEPDIRYMARDIDTYTERDYNNYGWAIVNDVLAGKEQKKLFAQFSDEEDLASKYRKSFDGYFMIPVGDKYSYNDKIVFIEGTNQHPIIDRIIKVNGDNEAEIGYYLQEVIDYEGQFDALGYLENVAGERLFEQYTSADYQAYRDIKEGRKGHSASSIAYTDEDGGRAGSAEERTDTVKRQDRFDDLLFDDDENIEDIFARHYTTHSEAIGEVLKNTADISIAHGKLIVKRGTVALRNVTVPHRVRSE